MSLSRLRIGGDRYLLQLLILTALIPGLMALVDPRFFSAGSLRSMAYQCPEFALLSLAVMLTMLTGGIDLSVVGTALLSTTCGVLVMQAPQAPGLAGPGLLAAVACLVIVAAGAGCGLVNGLLVTKGRIPPILATLGTMLLYTGGTVVLTGGTTLVGFPEPFLFLGNGSVAGVPLPLLLLFATMASAALILNRTPFGQRVYLVGDNLTAARFAGIDTDRILLRTYALSGAISSLAGIIMVGRTNSVNADYGAYYLLLAILVAVLGGVSPSGGSGRLSGLLLAVICLQFLSSGLNLLRFSSFAKEAVWGGLLLLAMSLNRLPRRDGETRRDTPKPTLPTRD